jgi:phage tail protein X
MHSLTFDTQSCNGVLSEETTIAILDTYMRRHGSTSEARLTAVVRAASEAAVALACFQMTMRGDLIADLQDGAVVFRNAEGVRKMEPIGPIVRRVLAEVGA